jgi:hypothetical protein
MLKISKKNSTMLKIAKLENRKMVLKKVFQKWKIKKNQKYIFAKVQDFLF